MWDSLHAHGCHASFTRLIHLEYTSIESGHTVVTLIYVYLYIYIYICVLTTWLVTNMVDGVRGGWCNMGPQVWPQHWVGYIWKQCHTFHTPQHRIKHERTLQQPFKYGRVTSWVMNGRLWLHDGIFHINMPICNQSAMLWQTCTKMSICVAGWVVVRHTITHWTHGVIIHVRSVLDTSWPRNHASHKPYGHSITKVHNMMTVVYAHGCCMLRLCLPGWCV